MFFEKSSYCGEVAAPPSKSFSHRALICAALCAGRTSRIENLLICDDTEATIGCLRALGADISVEGGTATVRGFDAFSAVPSGHMKCGESASTLRFLLPVAMLGGKETVFEAGSRLADRPLDVYGEIALNQGLCLYRDGDLFHACGPLMPGYYRIPCDVSSQFASGLMLALNCCKGVSVIELTTGPVSAPYILMTAGVMRSFGANVDITGNRIIIRGGGYRPCSYTVEGDWSGAAPFFALNALGNSIEVKGLKNDTFQADRAIRLLLGKIRRSDALIDVSMCPDLVPLLMAVSPFFYGATLIGTDRMRFKESSRAEVMAGEMLKFGFRAEVGDDSVRIFGANEILVP
ncbi:MAG: 3-phosphoshikimate 1-carboxyvinyltransferase, partial [Clostridia bacterium]|nr:3-phosphoshikimate 1-carboxyvinyltransferase [Clostridia bacterium]